jgi:hypothetical protein
MLGERHWGALLCTPAISGTLTPMSEVPMEPVRNVRARLAEVVAQADREEREINRIIDERMANPATGVPLEDVVRETLARSDQSAGVA